ncbi:MAG: DUF1294 domain-containing protein [Bacteroidales bacterium]|nr:DUF1294 domain-containing protein [Bacteroidales bacterium]
MPIYLIIINVISGIFFALDKRYARKKHRRIPEAVLHLFELLGGVFINLVLMYTIRHKNKKFAYYWLTYLILLIWIGGGIAISRL